METFPNQNAWYDTWRALLEFHRQGGSEVPPPDPIPVEGWPFASEKMKQRRWEATLAWVRVHGVEYLLLGAED